MKAPSARDGLPALMRQTRKDKGYEGKGHRAITESGSRSIDIYILYIDGGGRIERRRYEEGDREGHMLQMRHGDHRGSSEDYSPLCP